MQLSHSRDKSLAQDFYLTKMQGLLQTIRSCQETVKTAILQHTSPGALPSHTKKISPRHGNIISTPLVNHRGLENTTVSDILTRKGDDTDNSWLWCYANDSVHNAVKQMALHNVGSLVVLKPGDNHHIQGIITERDYLKKIAADGRPAQLTRVRDIMTEENKLITVTSDTNILLAMQLMTENHIRHVPVIDGKIVGMISIGDAVQAVVEQQGGEMKKLNEFIRGDYY